MCSALPSAERTSSPAALMPAAPLAGTNAHPEVAVGLCCPGVDGPVLELCFGASVEQAARQRVNPVRAIGTAVLIFKVHGSFVGVPASLYRPLHHHLVLVWHRTIATMRKPEGVDALRAEAADAGVELDVRLLDVTDAATIERESNYCRNTYGRLDEFVSTSSNPAAVRQCERPGAGGRRQCRAGDVAATSPAFRIQTSEWARDFVATRLNDLDGGRVTSMTAGWVGLPGTGH